MPRHQDANIKDLQRGYLEDDAAYHCLGCGTRIEKGIVYPVEGQLFEASRFVRHHIDTRHQSPFAMLVALDKQASGLTDVQRRLLTLWQRGVSDEAMRDDLGVGSTSTVRNHRLLLREKERQARVFLAIMSLVHERSQPPGVDKSVAKYLPDGRHLVRMPLRDKARRAVSEALARQFESGRVYSEKEVNGVLREAWHDTSALRRYMVSYGFLCRKDDGSAYWRPDLQPRKEPPVDRKTELKRQARAVKPPAGIYQIKNVRDGRSLLLATHNLKSINRQQFQLEAGLHPNRELQQDWNELGRSAFSFDIIETLKEDETDTLNDRLAHWRQTLKPGYALD